MPPTSLAAGVIRRFDRGARISHKVIAAFATAALSAVALTPAAQAAQQKLDFDCTVEGVIDPGNYADSEAMWKAQHPINKPEHRRITAHEEPYITYGVGGTDAKNWKMPITKVFKKGEDGRKNGGVIAKTEEPDQWGYSRSVYVGSPKGGGDGEIFWTVIDFPNGNRSASFGSCTQVASERPDWQSPDSSPTPSPELRNPNKKSEPQLRNPNNPDKGEWRVPFDRTRGSIRIDGKLDDKVSVRWTLDTGASITHIPYNLAVQLNVRVIGEHDFKLADGTKVSNQVVRIKRITISDVYVEDLEASVGDDNSTPLLGKNFLDAFKSYEINNAESLLILKR
jgi:hypothetical protein